MAKITQNEIDEVIQFVVEHYNYKYTDYKYIYQIIAQHATYNTMLIVRSAGHKIIAVSRWNILPTRQDAIILDLIIHPAWRVKYNLARRVLLHGLRMYPDVKYLIYERHDKGKPFKKVPVKRLLNRRF